MQVDLIFPLFFGWSDIPLFNCEIILSSYCWSLTLYRKPQFVQLKKSQAKSDFVKKVGNTFIEFPKEFCFNIAVFLSFFFSYMFSTTYITKLRTEVQNWPKTFKCDGTATFIKDLALIQETKLQNTKFTRLYSVTVLITFSK